ncbi:MAG: aldehyde dehydrogenase family protein, partial [Ilumatobacter sp.]|nr:aldehyde dehydrogenase family protein [Ilumatobacter sp.]
VVGAVLPWNYPLMMAAWKIGPALAAGNTMVLKPAEQTSMSTIRIAELATEAGLPDGVINVVPGFGETAGAALGLHPQVDCVGFTGSTEVGRMFLRYSADSNLKRVLLECGGKSPMVVMSDAEDLDKVAANACEAIFWNAGQNCSSNSRLLLHESIADETLDRIDEAMREWVLGDPLDPHTRMGAIIEPVHMQKILASIDKAKEEGATVRCGGNQTRTDSGGYFVEPTILTSVTPEMSIACDEVFGPVLSVSTFTHADEGIAMANDTDYGLHASVFTSNVRSAHLASRMLRAGTVSVNCYSEGDMTTPFGGYGLSGFGGRDNGVHAHEQYTETKTIWVDLS